MHNQLVHQKIILTKVMASSILLNKPVVSLVLGAAAVVSYYRLFDTKDECIVKVDGYGAIVVDVVSSAIRGFVGTYLYVCVSIVLILFPALRYNCNR